MSDEERRQVGICYKEQGQEQAIKKGRELVPPALQAQRVAAWRRYKQENPDACLYCFRGGLRSRITQQWLAEIGVEIDYVEGGYKTMRQFLVDRMTSDVNRANLMVITGKTGVGKTRLINRIHHSLDLEGLAPAPGFQFWRAHCAAANNHRL